MPSATIPISNRPPTAIRNLPISFPLNSRSIRCDQSKRKALTHHRHGPSVELEVAGGLLQTVACHVMSNGQPANTLQTQFTHFVRMEAKPPYFAEYPACSTQGNTPPYLLKAIADPVTARVVTRIWRIRVWLGFSNRMVRRSSTLHP